MNANELRELAAKIAAFNPEKQPNEMPDCLRCKGTFTCDSLDEVTPLCHGCAHETVRELAILALEGPAKAGGTHVWRKADASLPAWVCERCEASVVCRTQPPSYVPHILCKPTRKS